MHHFDGKVAGKTFALWGLAFKPNTDDMREAPALVIINDLVKAGAKIRAFDPVATETAQAALGPELCKSVTFCKSAMEAVEGADALAVVTEWNEFRHPDFTALKKSLKTPLIFDGRNVYDPKRVREDGFTYFSIGRI